MLKLYILLRSNANGAVVARIRHLDNAPITEALIDLRVKLEPNFVVTELHEIAQQISNGYPSCEPRRLIAGSLGIKEGKPINTLEDKGIQGFFCKSADNRKIAQLRIDGFTYSLLAPYTRWQDIVSEAKKLWSAYQSKTKPIIIDRVATRYINRIDLPLPVDLDKFLQAGPKLPKSLPQELKEFFVRTVTGKDDLNAIIIQTITESPKPGFAGILLDIDVSYSNIEGIKDDEIWPTIGRLRDLKNRIFFGLITEKTVGLLK
jgi:uncharacterized protein (TIGR04255 family)